MVKEVSISKKLKIMFNKVSGIKRAEFVWMNAKGGCFTICSYIIEV